MLIEPAVKKIGKSVAGVARIMAVHPDGSAVLGRFLGCGALGEVALTVIFVERAQCRDALDISDVITDTPDAISEWSSIWNAIQLQPPDASECVSRPSILDWGELRDEAGMGVNLGHAGDLCHADRFLSRPSHVHP